MDALPFPQLQLALRHLGLHKWQFTRWIPGSCFMVDAGMGKAGDAEYKCTRCGEYKVKFLII